MFKSKKALFLYTSVYFVISNLLIYKVFIEINVFILSCYFIVSTIASYAFAHRPNINFKNILLVCLLPLLLWYGCYLTIISFPNLSDYFIFIFILGSGALYYVLNLINNIFLVIDYRKETIPLYRVAKTWMRILLVMIYIPFITGILKVSANFIFQDVVIFVTVYLLSFYLIWFSSFDNDTKKITREDFLILPLISGYISGAVMLATNFYFAESLLRALFISAVIMFSLSTIDLYLENKLTKKVIFENILICLLFLILMMFFSN